MFKIIGRLLFTIFVLVIIFFISLFVDYKKFLTTSMVIDSSVDVITIKPGDTISTVIGYFSENGLPLAERSPFPKKLGEYYFRYLAKSSNKDHQLKIGEYKLNNGMTPVEVLDILISGKTITYTISFLEGWSFKQLRSELQNNPHIDHTLSFIANKDILPALNLGNGKTFYEGQFFPDTYKFSKNTKDSELLKQSYNLMQKNIAIAWQARDKSINLKSPYELLILASIIEKETSLDSERKKISGVFHRRLLKGMPLQADPTVIYGLGDRYKGVIYKRDLKRDNPYNTYIRKGLPPTPIALPGMASLIAAGQPDKGSSLYFVTDGRGGHVFSDTYRQHLKAVKEYRKQVKIDNQKR